MITQLELTPTKVLNIVRANTSLLPKRAYLEGSGFDFLTFTVDDKWIFRFPKDRTHAEAMQSEREFTNSLSLSFAIPKYEFFVNHPVGFNLPIAGYRRLPGTPLQLSDGHYIDTCRLSKQLGQFLGELHSSNIEIRTVLQSPVEPSLLSISEFRFLESSLTPLELELLRRIIVRPRAINLGSPSIPIHGDLSPENILIDRESAITGILDWTNYHIGSPILDFVGLWMWGGDTFVDRVLSHYELSLITNYVEVLQSRGLLAFVGRFASEYEANIDFRAHYWYPLFRLRLDELLVHHGNFDEA